MTRPVRPAWVPQACSGAWLSWALTLLGLWALIVCVLVWRRVPAPPPPALPERMQWQGRWLSRVPSRPPAAPLPDGVVLQSGADYGGAPGQPRLALRWLVLASSGGSVGLHPELYSRSVLGPRSRGVCRIHDVRTGLLLGVATDGTQALALLRRSDPTALERLPWLLGLRPWRINRCLFVGVLPR
ncbi:MAG: hypothetical protein VKI63_02445 [Cyanobium sp.]|nr:hypothetical protein [Cyanobium sp.]